MRLTIPHAQPLPIRFWILSFVIALLVGLALPLVAYGQTVDVGAGAAEVVPPGWGESIARAIATAIVCLFIIEGMRWGIPGWEREPGIKLSPSARKWILLVVVAYGQLCAFIGYPGNTMLTTPYQGVIMASIGVGLAVSLMTVVLNETLWKRLVNALMQRVDAAVPPRVRARRAAGELTPAPGVSPVAPPSDQP